MICLDEFGPLNLQPQPGGRAWAPRAKPRRIRASFIRPHGVRHLLSAYDVSRDRLYGHIKKRKGRVEFSVLPLPALALPGRDPPALRARQLLPHKGHEMRDWAADNNVELAYTPHYASWLNRIEAQFKALRYFTLNGTDHPDHATQARLIRRYIAWRNHHAHDPKLRHLTNTATLPDAPLVRQGYALWRAGDYDVLLDFFLTNTAPDVEIYSRGGFSMRIPRTRSSARLLAEVQEIRPF